MIDVNKLNIVKGILSAKNGTEIPKFQNPAGPLQFNINDPEFIKWSQGVLANPGIMSWDNYSKLKQTFPDATTQDLINYFQGSQVLPNNLELEDVLMGRVQQPKQTTILSSSTSPKPDNMEIPGAMDIGPNTAVENASDAIEVQQKKSIYNEAADGNLKGQLQLNNKPQLNVPPLTIKTGEELLKSAGLNASDLQKEAQEKAQNLSLPINAQIRSSIGNNIGQIASQAIQGIGNAIGAQQAATDSDTTKTLDSVYGSAANIASQFGPIGQAVGGAMKIAEATGNIIQSLGGGTDQQTTADKWMDSAFFSWNIGMLNGFLGKKSDKFSMDQDTIEKVGSSYGGSVDTISDAAQKANKKYGLFSNRARKKANEKIDLARTQQNTMTDIADDATEQRLAVSSMGEQAGLAYSMMVNGGYDQKYTYAAKQGGMLEWNPVITLEWEPTVELNWELPVFKEGGNVELVEELEWIPEFFGKFKKGGSVSNSDVVETEETTQKNVIPEGALHKNKHHMEHAEGLTKKGIPVIDDEGEQQAEIEHSEIIFTLEVTKKLEEYYNIFYSDDTSNKEKEQAALDVGKLLVYQILENTEDRTGLIESCKNGGILNFKTTTDDLIEEALEQMPTLVIVEEEKVVEKPKKDSKKDEKEIMKEVIKEALIELLTK